LKHLDRVFALKATQRADPINRLSFDSSAFLSFAGVIFFESTTLSCLRLPTAPSVKTFEATGFSRASWAGMESHTIRWNNVMIFSKNDGLTQ
ncbi:MAG: hypothetical protein ACKOLA_12265, partial [Spartobacteria bacterium]